MAPKVRAHELQTKSKSELTTQLDELKKELLDLRVQKVVGGNSGKLIRMWVVDGQMLGNVFEYSLKGNGNQRGREDWDNGCLTGKRVLPSSNRAGPWWKLTSILHRQSLFKCIPISIWFNFKCNSQPFTFNSQPLSATPSASPSPVS